MEVVLVEVFFCSEALKSMTNDRILVPSND